MPEISRILPGVYQKDSKSRQTAPGSFLSLRSKGKVPHACGQHHLYIGVVYIPPRGAKIERYSSSLPAYDILQQVIAEVCAASGVMIVTGDFNARTASAQDLTYHDEFADLLDPSLLSAPHPCKLTARQCSDKSICPFGKRLLEICQTADLAILKGRVRGDEAGLYTRPQKNGPGGSVVDYFLATSSLMASVSSLIINEEPGLSDHCSLRLGLTLQAQNCETPAQPLRLEEQDSEVKVQKIKFRANRVDIYREKLSDLLDPIFNAPNAPHTWYATALQDCIAQAALASFGQPSKNPSRKVDQTWYELECKHARAALKMTVNSLEQFASKLISYQQLTRRKRRIWQQKSQRELCELASRNPQAFWRQYKERQAHNCEISREAWKSAFQSLYKAADTAAEHEEAPQPQIKDIPVNPIQPASPEPSPFASEAISQSPADLLNADVTYQDVEAALKRLKRHKAAGVDGIKAEFILETSAILMTPLVRTFNQMLTQGVPPCWCIGLIHPIYKAGDKDDPGKYRGITVVVILAKLYAMVLEARTSAWAEQMKCRAKGQAGFRKDFRTTDQIFVIQTLVQQAKQAKQAKQKLYCCFVDFKKAFDLVPHHTLWSTSQHRGMGGRVLTSLQSMYAANKACVLTHDGPTGLFDCSIGVKQGCPASPLLFSL